VLHIAVPQQNNVRLQTVVKAFLFLAANLMVGMGKFSSVHFL
jgi:hypothetical protein